MSAPQPHYAAEPTQGDIAQLLALFNQQQFEQAKTLAEQLVKRFPQHGFTWKALGAIHKKLGDLDNAITALTQATLLMPQDADVFYNLGNSFLEQGKFLEAARSYQQCLAIQPGYVAAHYNLGKSYQATGDLSAAESSYKNALALQPGFVEALSSVGVVLHSTGNIAEAATYLQRAVEINPNDALNYTNLANVLVELDQPAQAESVYRQALGIAPHSWQALYNLANLLLSQQRMTEAEALYVQVVQLQAKWPQAWFNLGNCLLAQQRHQQAEVSYREALRFDPDYAQAYNHLGIVQKEQERLTEAEQSYRTALRLKPDYVEVHNNLGNVLRELDRIPEAEQCYHQALAHNPAYIEAQNNLGIALKAAGRLEEARLSFEKAIAINPQSLEPHFGIATLKTYHDDDPHITLMEQQLGKVDQLKPEAQIRFWFAIGKMYEDLGRFDASFSAYEKGNRLKFATLNWDEQKESAFVQQITQIFDKAFFERHKIPDHDHHSSDKTPIFILGMPRSGTSLLEQILSTHPGVFGAGELMTLNEVIVNAMPEQDYQHYPKAIADFSAARWRELGEDYLQTVRKLAPDAGYVTDKMPSNFLHIGMIHLMFPNAKIIHAMRDPMDSGFSCFSRLFNKNNVAYSYDLGALGNYIKRYLRLMEHWHAVLPAGTILDCRYEDMVADTEGEARRVLAYIGLPWDERCLDFHQNKRRVKTASQAQVQKPIYKTSVARWKHYEKYLGHFGELIYQQH